jgi:DNA-binding HxlR family transcriptional regulator
VEPRIRDCPLARTVQYLGDWWAIEVLHEIFNGHVRFPDLQRNLELTAEVLHGRLKTLLVAGLLEQIPPASDRVHCEYRLTDLGRSIRPVILTMAAWGNRGLDPSRRSMILVDSRTGEEVDPVVVDSRTGRRVDTEEYVFKVGPAASARMRAYYQNTALPAQLDAVGRDLPADGV